MSQGRSDNKKHWEVMKRKQLRDEYEEFLESKQMDSSPHSAHMFAIQKLSGSHKCLDLNEREIILHLVDELPYMYD